MTGGQPCPDPWFNQMRACLQVTQGSHRHRPRVKLGHVMLHSVEGIEVMGIKDDISPRPVHGFSKKFCKGEVTKLYSNPHCTTPYHAISWSADSQSAARIHTLDAHQAKIQVNLPRSLSSQTLEYLWHYC
jgi:hypothetical protein